MIKRFCFFLVGGRTAWRTRTRRAIFMSKVHNKSAPKMILGMCWGAHVRSLAIPHHACSFILYAFLKIDCQHFDSFFENQNFAKYEIGIEISATILLAFILHYFKEKLMKNLSKNKNKKYFGANLGPFYWNLVKMNFHGKEGSANIKIFPLFTIMSKIRKTNELFLRKMLNWWMGRQMYRQIDDDSDLTGPFAT